jgi:signal transduction histidine kinase
MSTTPENAERFLTDAQQERERINEELASMTGAERAQILTELHDSLDQAMISSLRSDNS